MPPMYFVDINYCSLVWKSLKLSVALRVLDITALSLIALVRCWKVLRGRFAAGRDGNPPLGIIKTVLSVSAQNLGGYFSPIFVR